MRSADGKCGAAWSLPVDWLALFENLKNRSVPPITFAGKAIHVVAGDRCQKLQDPSQAFAAKATESCGICIAKATVEIRNPLGDVESKIRSSIEKSPSEATLSYISFALVAKAVRQPVSGQMCRTRQKW
jgi:hypothetical protein